MIDALSEDDAQDAVVEGKVAFLGAAARRVPSRKIAPGRQEE